MWNFFDKESHVTPFMAGTDLGKKKVLNLEGGFIHQSNATWTGDGVVTCNTQLTMTWILVRCNVLRCAS